MRHIFTAVLAGALAAPAIAEDRPPPDASSAVDKAQLAERIAALSAAIEREPERVDLYSRRGDVHFFSGKFRAALDDYEAMVRLRPAAARSHWRRGIAQYYCERFRESAAQFGLYHEFDTVDRENGIWRFLAQARVEGIEKARKRLIDYEKPDRAPLPEVYRMFQGKLSAEALLRGIEAADLAPAEREKQRFYGELYAGLLASTENRIPAAKAHLRRATRNRWAPRAGYGPRYMWHVARLHLATLAERKEKRDPDRDVDGKHPAPTPSSEAESASAPVD